MAVTITSAELEIRIQSGLPNTRVQEMLALASAAVVKWAPGAPDAAHDEAATRYAGYLAHRGVGETETSIGEYRVRFAGGHSPMMNSGASAVLAQWVEPRVAGVTK